MVAKGENNTSEGTMLEVNGFYLGYRNVFPEFFRCRLCLSFDDLSSCRSFVVVPYQPKTRFRLCRCFSERISAREILNICEGDSIIGICPKRPDLLLST